MRCAQIAPLCDGEICYNVAKAQKKARLAREKRERQQALVGLGVGAVILTVLIGAMSSQNRLVRYFSRGVFIVIVLAIIGLIVRN